MKIICTLNLKGGCAKTTTAVSMAELLATGFKSKHGTVKPGKGHLGHADTYHIAKAVEYELLFYEWERLEAAA